MRTNSNDRDKGRRMSFSLTRSVRYGYVYVCLFFCLIDITVLGWAGKQHTMITAEAVALLPSESRAYISAETNALAKIYCGFPDLNWSCMGEWGNGNANPRMHRIADMRREWDISFYCGYDPVLQTGKGYAHAPPSAYKAACLYFCKAVEELKAGRFTDGMRFAGVMLHYIQDCGSMPNMQPVHRNFGKSLGRIDMEKYVPVSLGKTPEEAASALQARLCRLVDESERRLEPVWEKVGLSCDEVKRLCNKELMPAKVVDGVTKTLSESPEILESIACECLKDSVRISADALYSVLVFAPCSTPKPVLNTFGTNLVFNASFEEDDGDRVPDGWYVTWLDQNDRAGRAEWYRKGTHWDSSTVRTGQFSVLLLWAPSKGLEWRQTWRHAVRVNEGEIYKATAWVRAKSASGKTWFALQSYDTNYRELEIVMCEPLQGDVSPRKVSTTLHIGKGGRWLRAILHSESVDGAVWFDDVEITRVR